MTTVDGTQTPAAEESGPNIRLDTASGRWILAATILGSGMVFLDGSVVNVALPRIQSELAAPLSGLQWIIDSYALFLAALLLVGGALGDIYGRKLIFLVGLGIFTVASVGCGLAPNVNVLIGARAVQGIGGALLVPGSLAMIKAVICAEDSSRAIGLWTGLSGTSAALGPLVGGYLIGAVSWRAVFFINVPLAALTFYITMVYVPPNRDPEASRNLDYPGSISTIVGLGGVIYGLIEGPSIGWRNPLVVSALVVGVMGLILFLVRESRAAHPMVPLGLFRSRNFSGCNAVTLGVYFSFNGAFLFLVLYLQQTQGYTPLQAGAAGLPISILLLLLSPRVGALMGRFGARLPMTVGTAIITLAFFMLMFPGRHSSYAVNIFPAMVVLGIGMSIFITPLTATVMGSVPGHLVGVASGVNNAVSRVAALLAIAVLGVVIAARFDSALSSHLSSADVPQAARAAMIAHQDRLADDPVPASLTGASRQQAHDAVKDAFVDGFHWAMGTCAVLCLICTVISLMTIRDEEAGLAATAT